MKKSAVITAVLFLLTGFLYGGLVEKSLMKALADNNSMKAAGIAGSGMGFNASDEYHACPYCSIIN